MTFLTKASVWYAAIFKLLSKQSWLEVPHQCQTLQCLFSGIYALGGHIITSNFRIDEAHVSACCHYWAGLSLHDTFSGVSIFLEVRNCVTLLMHISAITRCRTLKLSVFICLIYVHCLVWLNLGFLCY